MTENYIAYDQMTFEEQREYIWGTDLNKLLVRAYNIIFDEDISPIGGTDEYNKIVVMTAEQKQYLNELIGNGLKLAYEECYKEYTKEYFFKLLKNCPKEICKTVFLGIVKHFYEILHTKPKYHEYLSKEAQNRGLKNVGIWFSPSILKSNERRSFKKKFKGFPEQIYAATVYYTMNAIIDSLKNNEIILYGQLIISCFKLLEIASYNKQAKMNNKKSKIEAEKDRQADFNEFYKQWVSGDYDGLSRDDIITKIMKDHKVSECAAQKFFSSAKKLYNN